MTQKKLRLKKKRQRLRKKKEDKQKQQQLDPEPDQLRVPEEEKSSEVSEQVQSENSEAVVENGVENVVDDVIAEVNGTTDSVSNDPVVVDNVVVEIQYVPEQINFHDLAPMYRQFYHVFEAFRTPEYKSGIAPPILATPTSLASRPTPYPLDKFQDDIDSNQEATTEDKTKLSKRKLKQLTRMSVAELKQSVSRPDIVEMQDVTAKDPKLLVQLKSQRNTVPVPRHWCFKRKYLQGKRGFEKPAFNLPDFIRRTGIMEMRATLQDKEDSKTLKTKMRERIRPKMGKIDIDYQKLHDAFFKWQTKPKMTIHGDLYYEGKEFETRLKDKKPGELSEEMRIALGMPVGSSAHRVPPPWLIAMQRYGPPPSYPSLKIPGLNAPIPDGCSFGYHAGGWGKPPVDESGKPLYGDVFGATQDNFEESYDLAIDKTLWGELDSDSGESSDEEADKGDKDVVESNMDEDGIATPMEGLATPSGLTSIPVGMETPDSIELRKKKIEVEMEMRENQPLYQVLPEKKTDKVGASMMGSTHVYDVNSALAASKHPKEGTVELALDPSELDLDTEAIAARYQEKMRQKETQLQKEDLSDMLAEHVAKQKNKRKKQQITESKPAKKYKDFKF